MNSAFESLKILHQLILTHCRISPSLCQRISCQLEYVNGAKKGERNVTQEDTEPPQHAILHTDHLLFAANNALII